MKSKEKVKLRLTPCQVEKLQESPMQGWEIPSLSVQLILVVNGRLPVRIFQEAKRRLHGALAAVVAWRRRQLLALALWAFVEALSQLLKTALVLVV